MRLSSLFLTFLFAWAPIIDAAPLESEEEIIVELAPVASAARALDYVDRTRALVALMGSRRIQTSSLFEFDGANARFAAEMNPGEIRRFGRWVRLRSSERQELESTVEILQSIGAITDHWNAPKAVPATLGNDSPVEPIGADDFQPLQGYLLPPPLGMNVEFAWRQLEGSTAVTGFADVEGAWNKLHRDLPLRGQRVAGAPRKRGTAWFPHGTAVLGMIAGLDNGEGIRGMAPDTRISLYSIFRRENNGYSTNVAATLFRASRELKKGDVLLIEIQYTNVSGVPSFVPVEYFKPEYYAIRRLVNKGIIVVEVAGNGGLDLDEYMPPSKERPDSGAIIVGAGGVPNKFNGFTVGENLRRLYFSNFGSRVDTQNWGEDVVTTGYGDLFNGETLRNESFTQSFNGTSAAGALTAGACLLMQKYALTVLDRHLTPEEMRDLLRNYGPTQRGDATAEHIGRRPDLKVIFGVVETMKETDKNGRDHPSNGDM
jgi:microbial collagenase